MSVAPTTAAAGDAERAHYDMVIVRMDIAMRIQALRRVQRQRQVREAATPQVAETTGTPVSRRVRGGRQTEREDVIDDVEANPEVMSQAPSTPAAAAPPSREAAKNEPLTEATREVKKAWQRLFALAEAWPAQAVTSRLGAVSMLHERARVALVESTRADEHVNAARAEIMEADKRETEGAEKVPRGLVTAAAAAAADLTVVETACPGSAPRDATKPTQDTTAVENLARLESFARRARETAFDLNGGLSCLMEAVDSEARAELRMAWEAGAFGGDFGGRLRGDAAPFSLPPAHRLPNQWPLGSAIAFTGAFTGGLMRNQGAPTFAPVVPVAPLVAPVAHAPPRASAPPRAKKTSAPRAKKTPTPTPAGGPAETQPVPPVMLPGESLRVPEKTDAMTMKEPKEPKEPKKRPRPDADSLGRASAQRVRREPPGAAKCLATTKTTGKPCTFRAVYGAFCAKHSDVVPTLPGGRPRPKETGKKQKDANDVHATDHAKTVFFSPYDPRRE